MIYNNRFKNSIRNFRSGILKQTLNIILPFIIRTMVIYYLGSEYQGLSGLFGSILQMLSLAELGFSTAIVFALYKPISEGDITLICALVNYLKKVYRTVGLVVFVIGISLLPFLDKLIVGYIPKDINIYLLYLIYLFNAVISYLLFAYKSALLTAMQREDIVSNIHTFSTVTIRFIQILVLFLSKNYYVYILVVPIGTFLSNILLEYYSKNMFPHIIAEGILEEKIKDNLNKQVKALLISKIADTARNSFDNIIISSIIGLSAVTLYDNYLYIFAGIRGFFIVLVSAMQASVGNSLVEESVEKNYADLNKFTFLFMILSSWCTVCMFCLYQPFMKLWMSNDEHMLLSFWGMSLFCIYFYIINMNNTVNLYFHGNGFYWQCRWWYVIEAVANLILNILFARKWNINGILLATILTLFFFNFIPRINIIFNEYFKKNKKEFLMSHIIYFVSTFLVAIVTMIANSFLIENTIVGFIKKSMLSSLVSGLMFWIIYRKSLYFRSLVKYAKKIL